MPQDYVAYIAILIASLALLMVTWKMWSDRAFRKERLAFERSERAVRENHERNETLKREAFEQKQSAANSSERTAALHQLQQFQAAEQEKRELFEASEQTLRIRFMARQEHASTDAEARIKQHIEDYIKLEKWREGSWQRNLSRLEQASQDLAGTTSGVVSLIDEGPYFSDERMILETARVLDVFGSFQASVSHFAMPTEMSALSKELVGHITKILLSLSPSQAVRKSDQRKALLVPLRDELKSMSDLFLSKCSDFERDPSAFIEV